MSYLDTRSFSEHLELCYIEMRDNCVCVCVCVCVCLMVCINWNVSFCDIFMGIWNDDIRGRKKEPVFSLSISM